VLTEGYSGRSRNKPSCVRAVTGEPMAIVKITGDFVHRASLSEDGKTLTFVDRELPGFMLLCGKKTKRFYAQGTVKGGRQARIKIGEHPILKAQEAREMARQVLADIKSRGIDPKEEARKKKAEGITLREAMELHLMAKRLSPRTLEHYWNSLGRYVPDWLDKPLRDLGNDRRGVRERHRLVTERNGPGVANGVMRVVRAAYNRGLREFPELPSNPVQNVDFNPMPPRNSALDENQLRDWYKAVMELENPIRRDYWLFVLFTGLRKTSAATVKWEHVNLIEETIFIPEPKGGKQRAFTLPLSDFLVELLVARKTENEMLYSTSQWVFPANSRSGHINNFKERDDRIPGPHALRHTFATMANAAGVSFTDIKLLLNHKSQDVTFGYITPHIGPLRSAQEKVTKFLTEILYKP